MIINLKRHVGRVDVRSIGVCVDESQTHGVTDILHIFKFSTIRSTLYAQKIMVEVNIPVAEKEQHFLFKATPIPVQMGQINVISSVHSTYFLLNWDKTKYIAMSKQQLDNGKMLASGEMLYRPTVTTLLNMDEICEWQILLEGSKSQTACHLMPFMDRNVIITITENEMLFVYLEENTTIYEMCNGTHFEQRKLHGRGTILLDPNCEFKTESFLIRPQKIIGMNATQMMLPIVKFGKQMISNWNQNLINRLGKTSEPIKKLNFIQNSVELQKIMESTGKLVENADREWKMDILQDETSSYSLLSGIIGSISIFATILTTGVVIFYKCNMFGCLLRSIIGRSSNAQLESDGTLTFDLPQVLAPKLRSNQTNSVQPGGGQVIRHQLNDGTSETTIVF